MLKRKFARVALAFTAAIAGTFAAVAVAAPASAATTTAATATSAVVTLAAEHRDTDCRVWVDRRRDSATAFCWDLRRGGEVTLRLVCEREWGRGRYIAEETERVWRGQDRLRLSVDCRRGFDAGRAWVDLGRRGPR